MKKFMYLVVVSMVVATACSSLETMNAKYDDELYNTPKGDRDLILDSSAYELNTPQSVNQGSGSDVATGISRNTTNTGDDRNFDSVQNYYRIWSSDGYTQPTGSNDTASDTTLQYNTCNNYYYYGNNYGYYDDYYNDDYYYARRLNGIYYYDSDPYWSVSLGLGLWPFYYSSDWYWWHGYDYHPYHYYNYPAPAYHHNDHAFYTHDYNSGRKTQRRTSLEDVHSNYVRQTTTSPASQSSSKSSTSERSNTPSNRYMREARSREYYQRRTYNTSPSSPTMEKSQQQTSSPRQHSWSEDRSVSRPTSRSSDNYQLRSPRTSGNSNVQNNRSESNLKSSTPSNQNNEGRTYSNPRGTFRNEGSNGSNYRGSGSSEGGYSRPSSSGGSKPSPRR